MSENLELLNFALLGIRFSRNLSKMAVGSFDDNEGSALKSAVTGASSGSGYSSAAESDVASKFRSDNYESDSAKRKMQSPDTKVVSESQRITNRYCFNSRSTPFNLGIGDSKSHIITQLYLL